MWYVVLLALVVGFAAGWAFFKHRAYIKQTAINEANSLRNSAAKAIEPK